MRVNPEPKKIRSIYDRNLSAHERSIQTAAVVLVALSVYFFFIKLLFL